MLPRLLRALLPTRRTKHTSALSRQQHSGDVPLRRNPMNTNRCVGLLLTPFRRAAGGEAVEGLRQASEAMSADLRASTLHTEAIEEMLVLIDERVPAIPE